jgi:hypothetical protein
MDETDVKLNAMTEGKGKTMHPEEIKRLIKESVDKWSSAIVPLTKVEKFSGGLLNHRTMANHIWRGDAPDSFLIGRRRCFMAVDLAAWLADRVKCSTAKEVKNDE